MRGDLLHPKNSYSTEELLARLKALERADNRFAQRGGDAVSYDATGRIASLHADYILAGSIDASVINVTNINGGNINANSINGSSIKATEIDTGHLKAEAVTAAKIAAGTITANEIASNAITAVKINAGAVTAAKISVADLNSISATFTNTSTGVLQSNQGFFLGSLVAGGSPRSSSYDLDINDDAWIGDKIVIGGSSEYLQGSGAGNDLKAYFDDNFEFYKGGSLKAIVDDNIWTDGDLLADGSKTFLIKHPDGSDRYLRYSAQESPDVVLRYRGRGIVGEIVFFPPHFTQVTEPKGLVSANLTGIGSSDVYISSVDNAQLHVRGKPGTEFFFEVMAIRKGYLDFLVELDPGDPELPENIAHLLDNLGKIAGKNEASQAAILADAEKALLKKARNEAILKPKKTVDTSVK